MDPSHRPLSTPGTARRALPFGVAALLSVASLVAPPGIPDPERLWVPLALAAVIVIAAWKVPWRRLPAWTEALPPLASFVVIGLVRHDADGSLSGVAATAMLPVFWLALYGTRAQLLVSLATLLAMFLAPVVLIGPPLYEVAEWRRAANWGVVATIVGLVVQRLVAEVRDRSEEIAARASALSAVAAAVRGIGTGGDAHLEICEAASEIAGSELCVLAEPEGDHLVVRASAGIDPMSRRELSSEMSGSATALLSRERFFVPDAASSPAVSRKLQRATGVQSVLFEPVIRDGVVVALLIVGWLHPVETLSRAQADGISLLAAEAGAVMERAALLARVQELSRTDPLTGLANRRAWDEQLEHELARARRTGEPIAVAMLDLDHFKAFNDTHGHQAGDRLLKAAGAAWRYQLRTGDQLARYGGEEFAVLIPGAAAADAVSILERLRMMTPEGETVSIGVATWDGAEAAERLMDRADGALYTAKQRGRNRVETAGQSLTL